jgi:hypothetical protein
VTAREAHNLKAKDFERAIVYLNEQTHHEWCQEFRRWRSHVFLRSFLVPATLSKRGILPFVRFKLLFCQPFACFGFEAEGGEEVREHHHVLEPWGLGEQEVWLFPVLDHDLGFRQLSPLSRSWSVDVSISTMRLN